MKKHYIALTLTIIMALLTLSGCIESNISPDCSDRDASLESKVDQNSSLDASLESKVDQNSSLSAEKITYVTCDWPYYNTLQSLCEAATDIFEGKVSDVFFKIIDMRSGKVVDDKKVDDKTYLRLYTVYEIDVTDSYKKAESNKMYVCVSTGFEGYKEAEQRDLMKSAGIYNESTGIQVVREFGHLQIGQSYLFLTVDLGGTYNYIVNADQFNDGYLCLVAEVIKQLEPPASQETEGEVVDGGCGIDHEHLFFSERISTQALEIGSSENPQKFKLSITGDYADNILTELEDSYLAGETITFQLETITEHYYVVTMNGITIPQTDSDLEYTWFSFKMPEEDVVISITQKGVEIPPPPADSDNITFQCGGILAQIVLDDAQKETVQELLADRHDWIDEMPESVVNCYFTGFFVKAGYCINSGMLIDYISNRSRKLTAEEKAFVESLISMLEEPTHSGYEVEIKLLQYTWDGWGISQKTVGACDVAYSIIDALKAMKETGETVPMISDEVFEIGGGQYAAERGTMWIESGNKIYRLTPDLSQICLVETHFGEGKVLEITDAFKTNVNNAWHYASYDYYKGTYNKGDYTVNLTSVFKSGSTVQLSIKKIQIESGYDPNNTITVELISSVDQEVNIKLHCQQSDDNLAAGDYRTVQLKKGEPTTVDLTFGGWPNFTYWVYIEADYTKAEITINP